MLDLGAPGMVRVGTDEVEVTIFQEFLRQPFFLSFQTTCALHLAGPRSCNESWHAVPELVSYSFDTWLVIDSHKW